MNYLVKDYRFTNDEAEMLIDQAVKYYYISDVYRKNILQKCQIRFPGSRDSLIPPSPTPHLQSPFFGTKIRKIGKHNIFTGE